MEDQPLALVSGGAQRLGKVFALTLARRGYAILLHHYLSSAEAAKTADEIHALGVPAYLVQADLKKEADIISIFSFLDTIPQRLKILVNSAASMQKGDIREISTENWDETFALNLRAPFLLSKHATRRMTKGSLIVNISDAGAQKLWTGYPAYVASKSALETLTRLLAKTYAPDIRVNAIAPGLVLPSENITPEEWGKLVERLPLKEPASLNEVAAALTFLLDTPSITGHTIVVDGGFSMV